MKQGSRIRVATKYTQIARDHFANKGVHVDLIKLYGSMELAPLTGLADAIVDLVSTGSTLKANKLVEVEQIMDLLAPGGQPGRAEAQARRPSARSSMRSSARRERRREPSRLRQLATTAADFEAEFARVLHWSAETDAAIEGRVADILADVERRGDAAVLDTRSASTAGRELDGRARDHAGRAAGRARADHARAAQRPRSGGARVRDYHQRQLEACGRSWSYRDADGTLLGQKVTPLDRVGIYVPGGKAAIRPAC